MILSLSHSFIFARGIKTASTSIASELGQKARPLEQSILYKLIRRIPYVSHQYPFYDFKHHPHTSFSKAKTIIPTHIFNSCGKFGVVREPASWMMSGYKHWLRIYKDSPEFVNIKINSFEDFIRFRMDEYPPLQALQFIGMNGELLTDFIGNFHKLDIFAHYLEENLGFPVKIQRLNTAPSSQNMSISANEKALIEKACFLDYELFNFENLNQPIIEQCRVSEHNQKNLELAWKQAGGINFDPWKFQRPKR